MTHARSPSRARSRGVTPIAAALAVLVLGAGASCMWWLGLGAARDGLSSSRANAAQIQAAAKAFRAEHAGGCPTLSSLREEQLLSRNARSDDAWGNRFRIRCEDGEIAVNSAGPDGVPNNADDIRAAR